MPLKLKRVAFAVCDSCGRQVRVDEDSLIPLGKATDFDSLLRAELTDVYRWRIEFDSKLEGKERYTCDSCIAKQQLGRNPIRR